MGGCPSCPSPGPGFASRAWGSGRPAFPFPQQGPPPFALVSATPGSPATISLKSSPVSRTASSPRDCKGLAVFSSWARARSNALALLPLPWHSEKQKNSCSPFADKAPGAVSSGLLPASPCSRPWLFPQTGGEGKRRLLDSSGCAPTELIREGEGGHSARRPAGFPA